MNFDRQQQRIDDLYTIISVLDREGIIVPGLIDSIHAKIEGIRLEVSTSLSDKGNPEENAANNIDNFFNELRSIAPKLYVDRNFENKHSYQLLCALVERIFQEFQVLDLSQKLSLTRDQLHKAFLQIRANFKHYKVPYDVEWTKLKKGSIVQSETVQLIKVAKDRWR